MSTKHFWWERLFPLQTVFSLTTKRNAFLPTIQIYIVSPLGFTRTTASMFVWNLQASIDGMVVKHESLISLLCTIPGVDRNSAITIISEIGYDMSGFGSSKRLCCWAGLTPGNNESAGKKKSVRITRAGVYLKPALVQVAHAAVKATDNSYYRLKYEQISKRRGKKRAIIAIARMILTAIYQMMTTGEVWNPTDLFKVDMPETLKEKQLSKAVKQATKFLEKQGLTVA